jgi:hypothetical protein
MQVRASVVKLNRESRLFARQLAWADMKVSRLGSEPFARTPGAPRGRCREGTSHPSRARCGCRNGAPLLSEQSTNRTVHRAPKPSSRPGRWELGCEHCTVGHVAFSRVRGQQSCGAKHDAAWARGRRPRQALSDWQTCGREKQIQKTEFNATCCPTDA